ncbi:hypothetical protein Ari01nite_86560 [Paractinoplanes rishiriensis]|uniref:Uncharacterized protein n=1 Tax=Paractinoplanes rishiriensis TaxID=1050105 RepID=A0A919K5C0_9ACTN|nr:hypothetical protein Ari01nite_86560 [Actinoplanes rishiriensis]
MLTHEGQAQVTSENTGTVTEPGRGRPPSGRRARVTDGSPSRTKPTLPIHSRQSGSVILMPYPILTGDRVAVF